MNWLPRSKALVVALIAISGGLIACPLLAAESSKSSRAHVAGLVPVGTQPQGGLAGKIVYTHGGHGDHGGQSRATGHGVFSAAKATK